MHSKSKSSSKKSSGKAKSFMDQLLEESGGSMGLASYSTAKKEANSSFHKHKIKKEKVCFVHYYYLSQALMACLGFRTSFSSQPNSQDSFVARSCCKEENEEVNSVQGPRSCFYDLWPGCELSMHVSQLFSRPDILST